MVESWLDLPTDAVQRQWTVNEKCYLNRNHPSSFQNYKELRNKWRKNYMTCYKTDISREFLRIKINCRTFTVLESSSNLARIKCCLISTQTDAQNSNYFSLIWWFPRKSGIHGPLTLDQFVHIDSKFRCFILFHFKWSFYDAQHFLGWTWRSLGWVL